MVGFKVANIFSDHMVLQRDKNIRVFGIGITGGYVELGFNAHTYSTLIQDGRWCITIPPQKANHGLEMKITCVLPKVQDLTHENPIVITYSNIAIGEVFLAGGQSNMEMELRHCTDGPRMLEEDKDVNVRYYYTIKNATMDDEFYKQEDATSWMEFSSENSKTWSAVAYIYAKRLAKELGVTVGIIGCNWGGTSASCWMSKEALQEDKELESYLLEYEKAIEGKSLDQQKKEYEDYLVYHSKWEVEYAKVERENPGISWDDAAAICGVCQWPGPMGYTNPYRPHGLYETMIQRIVPYTIKGVIYYQGESDDHKPEMYQKLLTRLIRQWREDFMDMELPFLFVQLPMHQNRGDIDRKHWCILRENQLNTYKTIKNTGIAICIDCGEYQDIHPKDKRPVGERLALQALYHIYKKIEAQDAFGPLVTRSYVIDSKVYVECDYAEHGFVTDGEPMIELSEDGINFIMAKVKFVDHTIVIWNDDIKKPYEIRYCWTNYGKVTIFGKNGIPLAPFRIFL